MKQGFIILGIIVIVLIIAIISHNASEVIEDNNVETSLPEKHTKK